MNPGRDATPVAMAAPITVTEALTLGSVGINKEFITFCHVTMESDKYICVRETSPQNKLVIIDMSMQMDPVARPITADSVLMNPDGRILALKAQLPGTTHDHLQIFDIELKAKVKSHQMPEQVVFWKWITPNMLGMITKTSVYHWSIDGDSKPAKMFDRTANLTNNQIINYCCDPSEKWLVLIGIRPGSLERPQLLKGNMQLFSVDQQKSQSLEAHAASFASLKVAGNENPSTLICFASKTTPSGQIISKVHVIELVAQPGTPSFANKHVDLSFPSEFSDDFPVGMQISQKYGLIYIITKLGLLFVYDLETATAIYQNRISSVPIFLTTQASGIGGFYAVNRTGQVLQATVNEATIVPFVGGQLNNLELAVNLANRLAVVRFQELFSQAKFKMAAELAAESPRGLLRTRETVAKFQSVPVQSGQTPPVLQYFGVLLARGKLNAFESLELSRLVVKKNKMNLLENWLAEDKLELSEELGDLVKTVDSDLALKIYIKAKFSPKVVATFAERKEFDKILIYSKQIGYTPDYRILLQTMLSSDPQGSVNFALMMSQMEGGCPIDYYTITDLFLQKNLVQEATAFLLEVLKPNLPEHGFLQTKVLEINLATYPNVADSILANGMFSHYDRPRICQLCEKAGLFMRVRQLEQSNPGSHDKYNEERRGQSYRTTSEEEQAESSDGSKVSNVRGEWSSLEISFSDIVNATHNFSGSSKIGKGGYGTVYKGKHGKATVAIKMLDSTSKQGQKEFFQELEVLYRIWHPNLVKLVGACFEVQALVYEFLPNGSLEDCLKDSPNLLTWQMRTRIIYEICLALFYLHSKSVIHGDLKPANILLDSNFKSKLADFGLCRFLPEDMTTVYHETAPKGTLGYIDPWFYETGILRPGSDLYSFGITILNLLTGLPPVGLGTKARDADEKLFQKMIDPTAGNWPFDLAKELLYWSSQCCYHNEHSSKLLEDMSTSLEDMLAEIETLQEGRSKVLARRKTAAQDPFKVEKKKEEPVVIMVLKVDMRSEAYAQEIKSGILSMKGVHTVTLALKASEVSVVGVFNPLELIEYVRKKTNKNVAIVNIEQVGKKPKEESLKEEEEVKDEKKDNEKEEKDLLL